VRCRMEGGKGRQQSRKRNDVAEILERLQQASQGRVELARRKIFKRASAYEQPTSKNSA